MPYKFPQLIKKLCLDNFTRYFMFGCLFLRLCVAEKGNVYFVSLIFEFLRV